MAILSAPFSNIHNDDLPKTGKDRQDPGNQDLQSEIHENLRIFSFLIMRIKIFKSILTDQVSR